MLRENSFITVRESQKKSLSEFAVHKKVTYRTFISTWVLLGAKFEFHRHIFKGELEYGFGSFGLGLGLTRTGPYVCRTSSLGPCKMTQDLGACF